MTQIKLEGAHNVRDLDGLPAGDASTRAGVLLRSDALDAPHRRRRRRARRRAPPGPRRSTCGHAPSATSAAAACSARPRVRYSELDVIDEADLARRQDTRASSFAAGVDPTIIIADGYVELLELGAPAFVAGAGEHRGAGRRARPRALRHRQGPHRRARGAAPRRRRRRPQGHRGRLRPVAPDDGAHPRAARAVRGVPGPRPADPGVRVRRHARRRWSCSSIASTSGWGGARGYFIANGVDPACIDRWRDLFTG